MIASVSKEANGIVTCLDETRHGFEDGDYVTFSEVQGMKELNGCEPRKITALGPYTFSIGDTTSSGDYLRGGNATQVKIPKAVNFKPLRESIKAPEFLLSDFAKFGRPERLHVAFQALDEYAQRNGSALLRPWNREDAEVFVKIVDNVIKRDGLEIEVGKKLMEKFSFLARGDTCPINAVIGGIVAQELMKACSGKFGLIYHLVPPSGQDPNDVRTLYNSQLIMISMLITSSLAPTFVLPSMDFPMVKLGTGRK